MNKIIIFLGSVRPGRMADRVAAYFQAALQKEELDANVFGKLTNQDLF